MKAKARWHIRAGLGQAGKGAAEHRGYLGYPGRFTDLTLLSFFNVRTRARAAEWGASIYIEESKCSSMKITGLNTIWLASFSDVYSVIILILFEINTSPIRVHSTREKEGLYEGRKRPRRGL